MSFKSTTQPTSTHSTSNLSYLTWQRQMNCSHKNAVETHLENRSQVWVFFCFLFLPAIQSIILGLVRWLALTPFYFVFVDAFSAGSVWRGHCSHLQLLHTALSGHAEDLRCTGTHSQTRFTGVLPLAVQVWAGHTGILICVSHLLFSLKEWTECCHTPDLQTAERVRQTGRSRHTSHLHCDTSHQPYNRSQLCWSTTNQSFDHTHHP